MKEALKSILKRALTKRNIKMYYITSSNTLYNVVKVQGDKVIGITKNSHFNIENLIHSVETKQNPLLSEGEFLQGSDRTFFINAKKILKFESFDTLRETHPELFL